MPSPLQRERTADGWLVSCMACHSGGPENRDRSDQEAGRALCVVYVRSVCSGYSSVPPQCPTGRVAYRERIGVKAEFPWPKQREEGLARLTTQRR